jgi:lysozyme family protein
VSFDNAFKNTLLHEGTGPATAHPADPGGLTKYGISKRAYPDVDIGGLTLDDAKRIYRRDFWDALRLDELPEVLAETVFDAAVNSGKRAAVIWLQKSLGAEADGVLGPKTIAAANAADPYLMTMRFNGRRLEFLADLRTWNVFGRGWAKRVASNLIR